MVSGCAVLGLPSPGAAESPATEPVAQTNDAPAIEQVPRPEIDLDADLVFDFLLADIAERRGRPDVSLDASIRVAERTRDPIVVLDAFRSAMRAGAVDQALAVTDLMAEIGDDPIHVGFARVQALLLGGRDEEAAAIIETLLAENPDQRERIFNNTGEVFAQQSDPGVYLGAMESLVDAYPDDKYGYFALAYTANRARDFDVLGRAITRVLELDPDWEEAAIVRYVHLVQVNRAADAGEFADAFLERNPQAVALAERHARLLAASGDMEGALEHFEHILREMPDNGDLIFATALVRMQLQQWAGAEKLLKRHLKLNPRSDETRMHLGSVASSRERYDDAIDWYGQVTDDALAFEAQRRIAMALNETEGPEAALEHLRGLVPASVDEEVELLLTQEQVLRSMDRLGEAFELIDAALQEIPDNGGLLYARALLAAEMSLLSRHESDIRRVIELEPENAHAYNALGYTLADQTDRYDEALELISRALELSPNDPFILDSMGWVKFRLGSLGEAEEYLRRALSIRQDAEIAAHLGEVLWTSGVRDEARSLWEEALQTDPDNRTLLDTLKRLDPR